jgi:hypothetical protein
LNASLVSSPVGVVVSSPVVASLPAAANKIGTTRQARPTCSRSLADRGKGKRKVDGRVGGARAVARHQRRCISAKGRTFEYTANRLSPHCKSQPVSCSRHL